MEEQRTSQIGINTSWFKLGLLTIIIVSIYYFVLLITSIVFLVSLILRLLETSSSDFSQLLLGGLASSITGCCINYIRKIYKLSINKENSDVNVSNTDKINTFGAIMYFVTRPFFAFTFSLLIFFGIRAGLLLTVDSVAAPTNGLLYLNLFVSFFAGFSCGGLIDILEKTGLTFLQSIFMRRNI